jgi:hypothetical protein
VAIYRQDNTRDPGGRFETDRWTAGTMVGIALAAVIGIAVLLFAMGSDDRTSPSTTGQGKDTQSPNPPARAPAPPPAPQK